MLVITPAQQQFVDRALELRPPQDPTSSMMTMPEFINETGFDISRLYIDKFWASLHDGQMIYIDDELLKWMGYDAAQARDRKAHFLNMLKEQNIEYVEYTNAEYADMLMCDRSRTNIYPPVPTGRGTGKLRHILLDTRSFKYAVLSVGNGKGKAVKDYYLSLEDLVKVHTRYQAQFDRVRKDKEREDGLVYRQRLLTLEQESSTIKQELEASKSAIVVKDQELEASKLAIVTRDQELEVSKLAIVTKNQLIADKDRELEHTRIVSKGLLKYKLDLERSETVYIITSNLYADQGIYKVGRCGGLGAKDRLCSLNTAHPRGDDLFIVHEFKTNDSKGLETKAHDVMKRHRIDNKREWFHLPYTTIYNLLDRLSNVFNNEQDIMNEVTQLLHELECTAPEQIKWNEGVPKMICATTAVEEPNIIDVIQSPNDEQEDKTTTESTTEDRVIQFTFSIKGWTPDATRQFIVNVLNDYNTYQMGRKPSWTTLKRYLTGRIKGRCKRPNFDIGREQILRLCKDNNIVIYDRNKK